MRVFCLLFCVAISVGAASANPSLKKVRTEVRAVVEAQLKAFQDGDYGAAYEFASAGLQQKFTVPLFERLIRRGYPALPRHARAELGIGREAGKDRVAIVVSVYDGRGRQTDYLYLLVRQSGGWRIEGVEAVRVPKRGDI